MLYIKFEFKILIPDHDLKFDLDAGVTGQFKSEWEDCCIWAGKFHAAVIEIHQPAELDKIHSKTKKHNW